MYIGQCGGVSGQTKSLETGEWGLHLGSLNPSMSSPTLLAVLLQTSYFPSVLIRICKTVDVLGMW